MEEVVRGVNGGPGERGGGGDKGRVGLEGIELGGDVAHIPSKQWCTVNILPMVKCRKCPFVAGTIDCKELHCRTPPQGSTVPLTDGGSPQRHMPAAP